uniref:hypothetical protein n=1 Tax=Enterocloster aldenensis TaxID=358742 RepID=UPI001A991605
IEGLWKNGIKSTPFFHSPFFEGCRGEGRESAGICASFRLAKSFFINKIYKKVFTKDRRCNTITS